MNKSFRDKLIESEPINPTFKQKYEREVKAMLEKKLTKIQKIGYTFATLLGIGFTIIFATVAIIGTELPFLARLGFGFGAIFGLVWAGFTGWILKKGEINLKSHPTAMVGMTWGFTIIMVVIYMFLAPKAADPTKGIHMLIIGLIFLVQAAAFMISNRIDQAQLKTQEKLLELELRIAELAETKKNN